MEKLTLYVGDRCPFCMKVERFLDTAGIKDVEIKNINKDREAMDYLIEKGGKRQVPCLFVGEEPMYESNDIINYFKEKYVK